MCLQQKTTEEEAAHQKTEDCKKEKKKKMTSWQSAVLVENYLKNVYLDEAELKMNALHYKSVLCRSQA